MPWRDENGKIVGGTYESWIDKQIREAQERGDFDDLPGAGKPLANPARPDDPDWWIKQKVVQEDLDVTATLPMALQLRKDAETLPDRILEERTESEALAVTECYNRRVRESWRHVSDGPAIPARLVDSDELLSHWRANHPTPPATPKAAETEPPDVQPPRWLHRIVRRLGRKPPLSA